MSSNGKLKIWGRKNSINVMKVLWTCEELGLPYDRVDVGGPFGGTHDDAYLAMNPNARVPTIQDGALTLWESNVCVRYLAHKYGHPGLWPADDATRWRAEQWMDWQQTTLNVELSPLFWQLIRTPKAEQDPAKIEAARRASENNFALLDAHLARHRAPPPPQRGCVVRAPHPARGLPQAHHEPDDLRGGSPSCASRTANWPLMNADEHG
jgi:glutathione S-transferase